jgi:hypothetical protein
MTVVQRKAILKAEGFFPHKKNPKGNTLIFSRNHPTEKFVRIVVDSGIDKSTGKIVRQPSVSSVYININKHWREIVSAHNGTNLSGLITAVESRASSAAKCKHCGAKKFKAKSGNVVCANACWTRWANKKKSANTTKKSSQKKPQKIAAKKSQKKSPNIVVGRVESKKRRTSKKIAEKIFTAEILPGDLVTVEQIQGEKVTENFTGKILGIVKSVKDNAVDVDWTANTSSLEEWCLPRWKTVVVPHRTEMIDYRFKVLSREVKYTIVT